MRLLPVLAALLLAVPAHAQDGIAEIRAAWNACTSVLTQSPDDWTGWRRNFDGGYADHFEFHDGGDDAPSVLVETWLIDAIATQTDTSCYRPNGSLAFLFSQMTSPNMAVGFDSPALTREGRLYFAPDGTLLLVLTRILRDGVEVAKADNAEFQLARGCGLTVPHMRVDDVRAHLDAELGTIEGDRPEFVGQALDWCELGQ
jgi:hypothetical protein